MVSLDIDDPSVFGVDIGVRALQFGADGKIYVSIRYHNHLSVIHDPVSPLPTLTVDGVCLDSDGAGRNCLFGLPNIFYFREFTSTPVALATITELDWSVYPNPASSEIHLEIPNEEAMIKVYSCNGKIIYENNFHTDTSINTSGWPNGIYFITLKTSKGVNTKKTKVQHSTP